MSKWNCLSSILLTGFKLVNWIEKITVRHWKFIHKDKIYDCKKSITVQGQRILFLRGQTLKRNAEKLSARICFWQISFWLSSQREESRKRPKCLWHVPSPCLRRKMNTWIRPAKNHVLLIFIEEMFKLGRTFLGI